MHPSIACRLKVRYPNRKRAGKAVNRLRDKYQSQLRFYFCPFCAGYHLTHIPTNGTP